MDTKLSVGYNGGLGDLKKILRDSDKVKSVYTGGFSGTVAGGRPQYAHSFRVLGEQVEYAHSKGISFEVALNADCGLRNKSDKKWWYNIKENIKDLGDLGVDSITASHPFIMELVKSDTEMKLHISAICEIMTVRSALYYEKLGGDIITTSVNLNVDIQELERIKKALTKAKLRIITNEFCLGDCPWRRSHHDHYAFSDNDFDYHIICKKLILNEPWLLLTNNTIRPEDIRYYKEIADDFKLVRRMGATVEDLLIAVKAYSEERFDGNYISLIDTKLPSIFYIPNKELGGLIQKKWKCSKICEDCNYCKELFNRIGKRIKRRIGR